MSREQAQRKWNELFSRVKDTAQGEPRFSLRGARDYLYDYDGYSGGHRELDRIIELLKKNGVACEASGSDSPLNVSSFEYKYAFEDGGLMIYAGNYFFASPGQGAFIIGFKALRWLLDQLAIKQPRKFKGEGGAPLRT